MERIKRRDRIVRIRTLTVVLGAVLAAGMLASPASADAAKPGQSMTHMKTEPGLSSSLEGLGVVLYVQGGATAAVMGDSIATPNGQIVFHIPVTGSKGVIQHTGSNLVFFNTTNNQQVQLRNPSIDLKRGLINAVIPQAGGQASPVLAITNAKELKPKVTTDRSTGLRTTTYSGAKLALAPGIGSSLSSLLGLPAGSLADGARFGSADITLNSAAKRS